MFFQRYEHERHASEVADLRTRLEQLTSLDKTAKFGRPPHSHADLLAGLEGEESISDFLHKSKGKTDIRAVVQACKAVIIKLRRDNNVLKSKELSGGKVSQLKQEVRFTDCHYC